MNLVPFFESAVVTLNHKQTATLGNRNEYIGSSDVAGCIRKAYLQRKYPTQPSRDNGHTDHEDWRTVCPASNRQSGRRASHASFYGEVRPAESCGRVSDR